MTTADKISEAWETFYLNALGDPSIEDPFKYADQRVSRAFPAPRKDTGFRHGSRAGRKQQAERRA